MLSMCLNLSMFFGMPTLLSAQAPLQRVLKLNVGDKGLITEECLVSLSVEHVGTALDK